MAYTTRDAIRTLFEYMNLKPDNVEFIENTADRAFIMKRGGQQDCVIFIYPISHKSDDTKNFFDTRDSGAYERAVAWNYALQKNMKYFCFAVHDQVLRYKDYIFSLECDENTIATVAGTKDGVRAGSGTQVVIPNNYAPTMLFERILTRNGFFISAIHRESIYDYIEKYDNRPYLMDKQSINVDEISQCKVNEADAQSMSYKVVTGGANLLFYGVPGAGKSHEIDSRIEEERSIRVVFHPDYTYSDFIGQILPRITKDANESDLEPKLRYVFCPGPFTKALYNAYNDPENMYYLIIEEINRGNAPAIFGDIFQLLDREADGTGKYQITNYDIGQEIYGDENIPIQMPSNLMLMATMNTSDQNIFTLDTAFQRRWEMHLIPNDVKKAEYSEELIEGTNVTWGDFAYITNEEILHFGEEVGNSGDKRLGAYFVSMNELKKDKFPEKVLKYLWDDAFKMDPSVYFKSEIDSLDAVIEIFHEEGDSSKDLLSRVLQYSVYEKMLKGVSEDSKHDNINIAPVKEEENGEEQHEK